jgi:hypothetical protein
MIAQALQTQKPQTTALTQLGVFALLDETVGESDSLALNPNTQLLSESMGENDSLQSLPTSCSGFRLDSAEGGRCVFSLDANYAYGGAQLGL